MTIDGAQDLSEMPDIKKYPDPPVWRLGVGLISSHPKTLLFRNSGRSVGKGK
jgi:hypothetical protein